MQDPASVGVATHSKSELPACRKSFLGSDAEQKLHYYTFNIGDYASHTRHLTHLEDLAYRRLLDAYYLQERPLHEDVAMVARQINFRDHIEEVAIILNEFFSLVEGTGWVNLRADEEIAKYHSKLDQASRAGKASAQRRLIAGSTPVQPNKKQETVNKKQEPIKEKALTRPDEVSEQTWNDFVAQRKQLKASITATALQGIQKEATKANWTLEAALIECTVRGWRGFKAEWVNKTKGTQTDFDNVNYGKGVQDL
jgi:uncharacterized protein YdaU (DUF1376 family)